MAGYNLWIERADPLSDEDIALVVDSGLHDVSRSTSPDPGEAIATMPGVSGNEIGFYTVNGRLLVRGSVLEEQELRWLIDLARVVNGSVVGAEGEVFGPGGLLPD